MRTFTIVFTVFALAVLAFGVPTVSAQTAVDAQWAQQFVGSWDVTLETPDGDLPLVLTVRLDGGSVSVEVGDVGPLGGAITDIWRSEEDLVASYDLDYQGMPISAVLRIRRDGDAVQTRWSFADGAYETSARGTRK